MDFISKEEFDELASIHSPHCVTITMPTHRSGMDVNEGLDIINFKNKIKEIRVELAKYQLTETQTSEYINPLKQLVEDSGFWREQSEGLAVFLADGFYKILKLPFVVKDFTYVSDHFYLRPLLKYFMHDHIYYVLALSKERVKLYQGSLAGLKEIDTEGKIPKQLEDVVGYDYETELQWRNGKVAGRSFGTDSFFHGHGEGDGKAGKQELLQFFRGVDNGIDELFGVEDAPLVLVADAYEVPIYHMANNYKNLLPEFVQGNFEQMKEKEIHQKSQEIVQRYYDSFMEERIKMYRETSPEFTGYELQQVLPEAINGRVESLFIQEDIHVWGQYDETSGEVIIDTVKNMTNVDLVNLVAITSFRNKGKVYELKAGQMPAVNSYINAVYRY